MYVGSRREKEFACRIRASEAEHLMTSVDQFSDDCGTDEACSSGDKNTHILFLLAFVNSVDRDAAFTPLGSRVEAFAVINLHSWAEVGRPYEGSRAQIQGAIDALVKRAIKNGDIRRA